MQNGAVFVLWFSSLLLPITIAITYFSIYYLIPKHLFPKEYGRFALYSFFTLVASSYFREEVLHIKEYIELEKIRFQDTLKVEFNFSEIHEEIQIAPMLLIPFVENAFKHGELTQGYLRIRIDIVVEDLMLDFSIKNSVLSKETEENENGIGLENFRKRLDLNYKDNYILEKSIADGWYIAHLRIPELNKINNG